jgi:hypothetical protein
LRESYAELFSTDHQFDPQVLVFILLSENELLGLHIILPDDAGAGKPRPNESRRGTDWRKLGPWTDFEWGMMNGKLPGIRRMARGTSGTS